MKRVETVKKRVIRRYKTIIFALIKTVKMVIISRMKRVKTVLINADQKGLSGQNKTVAKEQNGKACSDQNILNGHRNRLKRVKTVQLMPIKRFLAFKKRIFKRTKMFKFALMESV